MYPFSFQNPTRIEFGLDKEKEIIKAQAINEGKPEAVAEKIVAGRIDKFYEEVCLLEQDFIKDPDKKVQEVLTEKISSIGENITIRRFVRFERGMELHLLYFQHLLNK